MLLTSATAGAADGGFLFVAFNGEATPLTEQVYFVLSRDGHQWDALNGAEPVADFHFPFRLRHGAVLPVAADEYTRLKTAFGGNAPAK